MSTTTPPGLRPMTPEDLDACAAMAGATPLLARYDVDAAAARRLLAGALDRSDAAVLTVAELRGTIVGFTWFVLRGAFDRSGYLRLIVVDPAAQGRGVGQALLARLERRFGGGGIVLLASEHNAGAHRFYERRGYRHVGTLPGYVKPGLDERIYLLASATAADPDEERR